MRLNLIRCVGVLLIYMLLTGSVFAQQVSDLFATDRFLAVYLNLQKPYESAIEILRTINDPANASFKKTMQKLYDTAFENFYHARHVAKSRVCAANMRLLHSAIEMYNMDNEAGMSDKIDIKALVEQGFIKTDPVCPIGGSYSIRGDMFKDGQVVCSVHNTVDELNQASATEVTDITFEDVVLKIVDFHDKVLLRPTGGLYVTLDPGQGFGLLIETTGKPQELVKFLKEMQFPVPEPESSSAEKVVFVLPTTLSGITPKLNLTPSGIYMNAFTAKTTNNVAHWSAFKKSAQKEDNHLVVELLPEYIHDHLPFLAKQDSQEQDPQQQMIKSIKALRLILGERACLLVAGVPDETSREGIKELLSMFITQFVPVIEQGMDNHRKKLAEQTDEEQEKLFKNVKAMLKSLKVMEKNSWVGLQTDGMPGAKMIAPVVGVLAAIAIPNFQSARAQARQKACFANQRVLSGAVEMYNMDQDEMMKTLDVQALISAGYLKSEIICPEGGVYSGTLDEDDYLVPECSIHGPLK